MTTLVGGTLGRGRLAVVGIGPGRADWCTPAVLEHLSAATDLVGYGPYLDLIPVATTAHRHDSGNRVEAERARHALDLAAAGRDVVVVSSGDPGVFAMASAIMEQLDEHPGRWSNVAIDVVPGITAAQAVASRVGAPLGHDFCVISLSDVLKPWELIERRVDAAASADFVIAFYNPRSTHRTWQFDRAVELVAGYRAATTPVVIGRHVGRPAEVVEVITLAELDVATVDMATIVVIGSSTTRRILGRPQASSVYTPRHHP